MNWTHLRPIQVQAIHAILESDSHCVITAETAGGKTEAAFLPILSMISEEPSNTLGAMYVGPLRALINDQFSRVEDLCSHLEMPVHRWHGDVDASRKAKLLQSPSGVLLITPESLESLFVNRSLQLSNLFSGLRFVVIDELHAFLGNERGLHLQSLLARMRNSPASGQPTFRTVALSATIGDMSIAQQFLDRDDAKDVLIIQADPEGKELKLRLHAYECDLHTPGVEEDEQELAVVRLVARDLVKHCQGANNLIFADSKSNLEVFADLCRETSESLKLQDEFVVHHGSLSREIREDAEASLKAGKVCTALCSSTLELGIDIGHVRMVGQIGAPHSVAGFKQRLGRSGRRDAEARIGRLYIVCREHGADANLLERMHLELVQAIAVSELLLEGWVEPLRPSRFDLSTLTHQIISIIAETGGIPAAAVYERLCRFGPFREIETGAFAKLLRSLGKNDVIEQMQTGDLILGLVGEKLRKDRDFYAAFMAPAEFSVIAGERLIGTLPLIGVPNPGDHLILAGRRWQIAAVDLDRAEIQVTPAKGKKAPMFLGGSRNLDDAITRKMRAVLKESDIYSYLDPVATEFLRHARHVAASANVFETSLVSESANRTFWFTWSGTRVQRTLVSMFASLDASSRPYGPALQVSLSVDETLTAIGQLARRATNPSTFAKFVEPKQRRKYDRFIDGELLECGIAHDVIELRGALELCRHVISGRPDSSTT